MLGWLSTSQVNENGCSNGGFSCERNKWFAHVFPKGQEALHFESISWRKVDRWLEEQRAKYDLR